MFSHFESLDSEDIGVWQDKENKSKKQRKCQSSFRPEAWPSPLHINIMKLSLSTRSPEEGEETCFPQNLEGGWRADGWGSEHPWGTSISRWQQEVRAVAPNSFQSSPGTLPVSPRASPCPQTESIWIFKNSCMPCIPCKRKLLLKEIKQKGYESLEWTIFLERSESCIGLLKRYLAGTGIFLAAH